MSKYKLNLILRLAQYDKRKNNTFRYYRNKVSPLNIKCSMTKNLSHTELVSVSLFFIFLLVTVNLSSQTKIEKEYRVKQSEVPEKCVENLNTLFPQNIAPKWYFEQTNNHSSYEAKFKWNKQKISVEFDSLSQKLEDVEVDVKKAEIPKIISESLLKEFKKYKPIEIQKQYSKTTDSKNEKWQDFKQNATLKYEIVLKTRIDKKWQLLEVLIQKSGEIERKQIVLLKNTDNLEF